MKPLALKGPEPLVDHLADAFVREAIAPLRLLQEIGVGKLLQDLRQLTLRRAVRTGQDLQLDLLTHNGSELSKFRPRGLSQRSL